jgi:hypothetical protein
MTAQASGPDIPGPSADDRRPIAEFPHVAVAGDGPAHRTFPALRDRRFGVAAADDVAPGVDQRLADCRHDVVLVYEHVEDADAVEKAAMVRPQDQ